MEKYCTAGQATDDNKIRCMRIACWIARVANTRSEFVMLIAFSLQQYLHETVSMLFHTYIACLV